MINRFGSRLAPFGDTEELLDVLPPPLLGEQLTHPQCIAKLAEAPHVFLPNAEVK
jgi:hypothetical protein